MFFITTYRPILGSIQPIKQPVATFLFICAFHPVLLHINFLPTTSFYLFIRPASTLRNAGSSFMTWFAKQQAVLAIRVTADWDPRGG
jgi:hypothetical protein